MWKGLFVFIGVPPGQGGEDCNCKNAWQLKAEYVLSLPVPYTDSMDLVAMVVCLYRRRGKVYISCKHEIVDTISKQYNKSIQKIVYYYNV